MLDEHLGYVSDTRRLDLYRKAVAETIRDGYDVVDLGCGTGVLGFLCLQAGARRVTFIDETETIEVARHAARLSRLEERCIFINDRSTRVSLDDLVDVVICDHVGFFGFDYDIAHTLCDAKTRFLKPTGTLIPSRLNLFICAVRSNAVRERINAWRAPHVPSELNWLWEEEVNRKHAFNLTAEDIICPPVMIGEIKLGSAKNDVLSWTADLRVSHDAVVDGLAGWFECELAHDIWMTNSPVSSAAISREQALLPLGKPTEIKAGEIIKVSVTARPEDNLLAWTVCIPAMGQTFRYATWPSMFNTQNVLKRTDIMRVPRLNRSGEARTLVLSYCDGKRTAHDIEEAVLRDHPFLFPTSGEISRFVAMVLRRDTSA